MSRKKDRARRDATDIVKLYNLTIPIGSRCYGLIVGDIARAIRRATQRAVKVVKERSNYLHILIKRGER